MAKIVVEVNQEGTAEEREVNEDLGELLKAHLKDLICENHGQEAAALIKISRNRVSTSHPCCDAFYAAVQARIKSLTGS